MVEVLPHRLIESVVMLPFLHAKKGDLAVAAVGTLADEMAAEALRWREVRTLFMQHPPKTVRERRVTVVQTLPRAGIDVLLLSPEQSPAPWLPALSPGGVVNPTTAFPAKWTQERELLTKAFGTATPWRNYLPRLIYGVLGKNSPGKPQRTRQPPKGAKHLSEQYLPCLFTFARDELPLALPQSGVRIANQPGTSYEFASEIRYPR